MNKRREPKYHCEPAHSVIQTLGGLTAVARIAGVAPHTVMRWRMPRAEKPNCGGTGGIIPHWHMAKLLEEARKRGIELSASDFLPENVA